MTAKSILALAGLLLFFAAADTSPILAANTGRVRNVELAGAGNVDNSSFYGLTTLNVLAGGVAITFSGWILSKRKIL